MRVLPSVDGSSPSAGQVEALARMKSLSARLFLTGAAIEGEQR